MGLELSLLRQGKLSLPRLGRRASTLNKSVRVEKGRSALETARGVLFEFRRAAVRIASLGRSRECSREVHGEEGFNALLACEILRSKKSGHIFEVLLVNLSSSEKSLRFMDDDVANLLFVALGSCLRQTDYFGWHREKLSVGAVLTSLADNMQAGEARQIEERLVAALRKSLLPADFNQIQLRRWQPNEFELEPHIEIRRV